MIICSTTSQYPEIRRIDRTSRRVKTIRCSLNGAKRSLTARLPSKRGLIRSAASPSHSSMKGVEFPA